NLIMFYNVLFIKKITIVFSLVRANLKIRERKKLKRVNCIACPKLSENIIKHIKKLYEISIENL
ncbi:hypothetical protein ACFTXL_24220, partial [Bacillus subtilis]